MRLRRTETITIIAATFVVASIFESMNVAANPIGGVRWYDSSNDALVMIFLSNFPVNLAWFSAALLVICSIFGLKVGPVPWRTSAFVIAILAVALIVTSLGALIDYSLLVAKYPFGYVMYYDPLNWMGAAALIFVSIYLSSSLLLRLSLKLNAIPAAAMTVMNLIWWEIAMIHGPYIAASTSVLSVLLAPAFLAGLWIWHQKRFHSDSEEWD